MQIMMQSHKPFIFYTIIFYTINVLYDAIRLSRLLIDLNPIAPNSLGL